LSTQISRRWQDRPESVSAALERTLRHSTQARPGKFSTVHRGSRPPVQKCSILAVIAARSLRNLRPSAVLMRRCMCTIRMRRDQSVVIWFTRLILTGLILVTTTMELLILSSIPFKPTGEIWILSFVLSTMVTMVAGLTLVKYLCRPVLLGGVNRNWQRSGL